MKSLKKFVASATIMAMAFSAIEADAVYECTTISGCGYQECCSSPCLTPAIALGAIAIVAIVAVALQNTHGGHSHHTHSHSD